MAIEAKCSKWGDRQASNMAVRATAGCPDKRRESPKSIISERHSKMPLSILKNIKLSMPSIMKNERKAG